MQRQVLERFDVRTAPAVLVRPVDGQHVVGELLAEHQGGGVGLGLACRVAFDDQVRRLRSQTGKGGRRQERKHENSAGGGYKRWILERSLLTEHASQLVGSYAEIRPSETIKCN